MAAGTRYTEEMASGSNMAARILRHDWWRTPLGPLERWPRALRTALDICLNSRLPTALYCGRDLLLIYNDAWMPVPAEKHAWVLGRPAREVWADVWEIVGPQFAHVLETGQGIAVYDQMLPVVRDGRACETYWSYGFTPIRDDTGEIIGIFNQGYETTEKVLAQRARESELDRLRSLFEQAPIAIALLHGPDHVYAIANAAYLRLIGRRDIIGKRVADVLPEVIEQGFGPILDNVYRTGEPYVAASKPVTLRRDAGGHGEERLLDFAFQAIRDVGGKITGTFIQISDVTERAQAEAALRASEENLRRLNEQLEALVAERTKELSAAVRTLQEHVNRLRTTSQTSFIYQGYLTPDGLLLETNSEYVAGLVARDVAGQPFWTAPWFTDTPGMPERIRECVAKVARGENVRETITLNLPDGERTFDFSMRPVKDEEGRVVGIVPEAVDLTPLLQAEERLRQSQKMEAIGQLTGGIAHDFNNLLTGIMGSLDMMDRRIAQGRYDRVSEYAKAAIASANRAAALTHRLLAFARKQPLDPRPVEANRLVADMEDMLRRTLGERIRLDVRAAPDLWLTRCDPNQLESAILNLAINARDAMPEGGRLTIETSNAAVGPYDASLERGEYVCICVSDTGTGMSAEVMEKAFDPFFTTKPLGQGTGLGLSMTYGFVRQSGGDVTIKSTLGEGTVIRLYLPRYKGDLSTTDQRTGETGTYRVQGERTVLVVEDDEVVRRLILDVLKDLGFRALEAYDGATGLRILMSDERIDLLISDIGLPEINGRKMAEQARLERPRLKVLFITGYADHPDAGLENLAPGMHVMTKPFPMEALAQRIQEIVKR